ncbi:MAG: hypothetical protein C4533_04535 [Candidatus Omnitrophota bacterium]|jgi:hypothetical protein|nr:MAG: hypothetical protein C4533_04535 [Candidatus Omnitrophota bacterium]
MSYWAVGKMDKDVSTNKDQAVTLRGWEALEIKLKSRGLSCAEIQEARKSFFEGIETLAKMFMTIYSAEKKPLV